MQNRTPLKIILKTPDGFPTVINQSKDERALSSTPIVVTQAIVNDTRHSRQRGFPFLTNQILRIVVVSLLMSINFVKSTRLRYLFSSN